MGPVPASALRRIVSLPPCFPAFCGRCRREPVQAERGGRRPLGWRPPDWRGLSDLLPDWRAGSQS